MFWIHLAWLKNINRVFSRTVILSSANTRKSDGTQSSVIASNRELDGLLCKVKSVASKLYSSHNVLHEKLLMANSNTASDRKIRPVNNNILIRHKWRVAEERNCETRPNHHNDRYTWKNVDHTESNCSKWFILLSKINV